jgi:hypothetical protein
MSSDFINDLSIDNRMLTLLPLSDHYFGYEIHGNTLHNFQEVNDILRSERT